MIVGADESGANLPGAATVEDGLITLAPETEHCLVRIERKEDAPALIAPHPCHYLACPIAYGQPWTPTRGLDVQPFSGHVVGKNLPKECASSDRPLSAISLILRELWPQDCTAARRRYEPLDNES